MPQDGGMANLRAEPTTDAIPTTAAALAAATPDSRNRYVDFLRVASMGVVVLGHWMMAVLSWQDGRFVGNNLLELAPSAQIITWALQVMPVFFIVGGFTNAASWESARRRETGYATWLRARSVRLLRPALYFVGFWTLVPVLGVALGLSPSLLSAATGEVALPLWFLSTYLLVVAAAPALLAMHQRFGGRRVLVGLMSGVTLVDILRYVGPEGLGFLGSANHALVWLAAFELGFLWRDGTIRRHAWMPLAMIAGGLTALAGLVFLAHYPLSMVGLTHATRSNSLPPSFAMVALCIWQFGAVLVFERSANRWLQRPKIWLRVAMANSMIMTFYLWNMTAVIVAVVLLYPTGIAPKAAPLSPGWWLFRPVWIIVCAACLVPFLMLFRRAERPAPERPEQHRPRLVPVILGTLAGATSFAILAAGHFPVPGKPLAIPLFAVACIGAAQLLLGPLA